MAVAFFSGGSGGGTLMINIHGRNIAKSSCTGIVLFYFTFTFFFTLSKALFTGRESRFTLLSHTLFYISVLKF